MVSLFYTLSCQKCKQCSYTYTKIETIQTVNGEEEVITEESGWILNDTGGLFKDECIKPRKNETFTIEEAYDLEKKTTDKLDFDYTCVDV